MSQVKFVAATLAGYQGLENKDANTLYFVEEEQRIYKGDTPYSGGIYEKVNALPTQGKVNTLYIVGDNGDNVAYWDGTKYVTVVKPTTVAADLSALTKRVTTAEGNISAADEKLTVIQGEGEGSIKKAAADAKRAAIDAAATDATSKADKALDDAKADSATKKEEAIEAAKTETTKQVGAAKTELQANIDKKADKATTLAGYGIADAYTKDEANTTIAAAVANAHHLKREIVSVLPEVSKANEDTIYMVPDAGSTDAAGSNKSVYTEYMLVNDAFERIGTSDVDLSNYFTKDQVTGAITTAKGEAATDAQTKADAAQAAAIAAAATDATTKADAAQAAAITEAGKKADKALEDAKAYSDGLAKNYATAVQGAKADSALQAADVVEGTVNGAISVKGTPVKVHGLGTAAYAATDDFATAAQGAKADSAVQAADVVSGTANGTISVKGSDVAVKGLGSAAYQNSGAFDVSGAAAGALTEAKAYADTKKTEAVDAAAKDATTKADNALNAAKKYADGLIEWGTL